MVFSELGTKYMTEKFNAISNIPCMKNTKIVITRNFRSAYLTPGLREPGNAFCFLELPHSVGEGSDRYELLYKLVKGYTKIHLYI